MIISRVRFRSFGEYGMVGQPNEDSEQDGTSNFGGFKNDIITDPAEVNPYHGVTRTEDVDVSLHTGIKEKAAEDQEHTSSDHSKSARYRSKN